MENTVTICTIVVVQVSTLLTNTVPNTTGTVMGSGSVYTGFIRAISGYIYSKVNCERWTLDSPLGWNADLTNLGPMCGGGGEVQVMSVETRGQADAGWLAATI